jgi:hypothetical protein
MLWLYSYFDDSLMTGIVDSYLYVMRLYVYSDVWMCEFLFNALYSYSLESLPLRSLVFFYERLKFLNLIPRRIGLEDKP